MISPAVVPPLVYSVRTQFDSQRGFECYLSRFYNFPQPSQLNSVVRPVHMSLPHSVNAIAVSGIVLCVLFFTNLDVTMKDKIFCCEWKQALPYL